MLSGCTARVYGCRSGLRRSGSEVRCGEHFSEDGKWSGAEHSPMRAKKKGGVVVFRNLCSVSCARASNWRVGLQEMNAARQDLHGCTSSLRQRCPALGERLLPHKSAPTRHDVDGSGRSKQSTELTANQTQQRKQRSQQHRSKLHHTDFRHRHTDSRHRLPPPAPLPHITARLEVPPGRACEEKLDAWKMRTLAMGHCPCTARS
jgi:hypothetical protein